MVHVWFCLILTQVAVIFLAYIIYKIISLQQKVNKDQTSFNTTSRAARIALEMRVQKIEELFKSQPR